LTPEFNCAPRPPALLGASDPVRLDLSVAPTTANLQDEAAAIDAEIAVGLACGGGELRISDPEVVAPDRGLDKDHLDVVHRLGIALKAGWER